MVETKVFRSCLTSEVARCGNTTRFTRMHIRIPRENRSNVLGQEKNKQQQLKINSIASDKLLNGLFVDNKALPRKVLLMRERAYCSSVVSLAPCPYKMIGVVIVETKPA